MCYDDKVVQLIAELNECSSVKKFQKAEQALQSEQELFAAQEKMKSLQKEAVLYQKIGKMQAFKETSRAAQQIELKLKNNLLVENYLVKLQDVNDLIQYVTKEIEQKVNAALEKSGK